MKIQGWLLEFSQVPSKIHDEVVLLQYNNITVKKKQKERKNSP